MDDSHPIPRLVDGLAVSEYGPKDGTPIVFSPGLGGHGAYWRPQVEAFAQAYRVILYDHRGTGDSDRDIPIPYTIGHLADDIRRLLDGLGLDAAHVVGHAAGGLAGLELARTTPERLLTLATVNGWAVADPYFKRCYEIRAEIFRALGVEGYLKSQPVFFYPAEYVASHMDEIDAHNALRMKGFQAGPALLARMEAMADFDIVSDLKDIHVPVLVVSSADDMLVPARSSRLLSDALPNVMPVEMPWGGHAVNVTATRAFNEHLMSFLIAHGGR
jgi:aminoacrylate hydrolase